MSRVYRFDNKYLVVKWADVEAVLDEDDAVELKRILGDIDRYRHAIGKKDNTYLVINTDEPYTPEVARIMEQHGHYAHGEESAEDIRVPRRDAAYYRACEHAEDEHFVEGLDRTDAEVEDEAECIRKQEAPMPDKHDVAVGGEQ